MISYYLFIIYIILMYICIICIDNRLLMKLSSEIEFTIKWDCQCYLFCLLGWFEQKNRDICLNT